MADINELMENPFQTEDFDIYEYWERNKCVGRYGVPYLDKELGGIAKTDLVLIGARSGAGKTSLAKIIYAANDKTKTALFSLENYAGDLESSLLRNEYNFLADTCYSARDWQMRKGATVDKEKLAAATERVKAMMKGGHFFGRTPPLGEHDAWSIGDLTKQIIWCATHGIELIIVDHLDYLDRDNPNESDVAHITELMKAIRKAQEAGAAIIAFSHLRKPLGKVEDLIVPNENEFIGSSNKVKQATQVILLAPANEGDARQGYGTWCCIRKNRSGGIKNQAAKMWFMPDTETYRSEYELYKINYSGTKAEPIMPQERPKRTF